jgi:hypothetical protein
MGKREQRIQMVFTLLGAVVDGLFYTSTLLRLTGPASLETRSRIT